MLKPFCKSTQPFFSVQVGADIHTRKKFSFSSERLSETVSLRFVFLRLQELLKQVQPAPSMTFLAYNDPSKMAYNDHSRMAYNDPLQYRKREAQLLYKMAYNDHYKLIYNDPSKMAYNDP